MAVVVVTLDLTVDGRSIFGAGPLVRRLEAPAFVDVEYAKDADNNPTDFASIPATALASIGMLLVRPSAAINLRLNGQSDGSIPLAADGLLLLLDTTLDTATLVAVNNPAEEAEATVDVVATGT